jgi:hypothetical protein
MQAQLCAAEGYLAYLIPPREPPDPDSVDHVWLICHRLLGRAIRVAILPIYVALVIQCYLDMRLDGFIETLKLRWRRAFPCHINPWLECYHQLLDEIRNPHIVLNIMLELERNPHLVVRDLNGR